MPRCAGQAGRHLRQTLEVPISGMCCAEEATSVRRAIASLPGVESVEVFLSSEMAVIMPDPRQAQLPDIQKAREHSLHLEEPEQFESVPGLGVRARVNGNLIAAGNPRMAPEALSIAGISQLEAEGKSLLVVSRDGEPIGVLAASVTLRSEVPAVE